MASGPLGPGANAVVGADEVVAGEDGVVAVGVTEDDVAIYAGTAVAAAVMSAQGVGEGARGRRQEGRGEGSGRALRVEGEARVETKGQHGEAPALGDAQEVVIDRREAPSHGGVLRRGCGRWPGDEPKR